MQKPKHTDGLWTDAFISWQSALTNYVFLSLYFTFQAMGSFPFPEDDQQK